MKPANLKIMISVLTYSMLTERHSAWIQMSQYLYIRRNMVKYYMIILSSLGNFNKIWQNSDVMDHKT